MEATARALWQDLSATMATINARSFETWSPGPASLSTMTVTATLNVDTVCRDSMAIALSLVDGDGPLTTRNKNSGRKRKRAEFFNQITMHHGTKSIKVFKNGSMHVTGCSNPLQFVDVATEVCALMGDVAGIEANDGSGTIRVTRFDVQMINLNFAAGRHLFLQDLRDDFAARGCVASYDADTYPGLNVKLPIGGRWVTALIFRSGKVIITGAKTAVELSEAHAMVTAAVDRGDPK